jgi:hypothetical protein
MFAFFRIIRKQLLRKGNTARYVKYAFGEIILVVLGIIIALQFNRWNIERVNSQQEIKILKELKIEYEGKLDELNQKENLRNIIIESTSKISQLIKSRDYNIPQDSLDILVMESALSPTYDASNSVTNELLNSGNLYLIHNEELRKKLLDWDAELAKLDEEEQYGIGILSKTYLPYLFKYYPYNSLLTSILNKENEIWRYIMESTGGVGFNINKSNQIVDIERLFNDVEFESIISYLNANWIICNMHSKNLRVHIEDVFDLINQELAND